MFKIIISEIFKILRQPLAIIIAALAAVIILIPLGTYILFAPDLGNKESIMNRNNGGVILLDRHDRPFFYFYQPKNETFIPLSQIAIPMQHAVISSEDREFYTHKGISFTGILRAFYTDVILRQTAQGGSTITQQLVKNALLNQQKSFFRKYQEIILAYEIERRYSKQDILEMYLNSVYFGEGAFGIENASETYFDKHAKDLTITESALLTGLLPSPSTLSPLSNGVEKAKARENQVLLAMAAQGFITSQQVYQMQNQELSFHPKKEDTTIIAPHFALLVKEQLIKKYGEEFITRSGFHVRTTLDLDWQTYAEKVVRRQVAALAYDKVTNGAAVVEDPKTGEIKAYVGSEDWNNDQFGKVDMANTIRQPGSSFKPLIYASAFENRYLTPATVLQDIPTTFPGNYKPLDYDKKFRGPVLARRALANSLNIPAVAVMQKVGVPTALDMAKRLGITTLKSESDYGLSLVLGTGEIKLVELTNAYAVFANNGVKNDPTAILAIKDKNDNLVDSYTPVSQQVLASDVTFLISSILSDNNTRAEEFGNALTISRPAAVKTGTTEDFRDALTLGYTPSLVVGVWVGNNDTSPMDNIAGSLGAAPIWRQLMEKFLSGTPIERFEVPTGVTDEMVCRSRGLLASNISTTSAYTEYFISGTEPTQPCGGSASFITPFVTIPVTPTPTIPTAPTAESATPTPTSEATPTPTTSVSPTLFNPSPLPITPKI